MSVLNEHHREKIRLRLSDQVRHKSACSATKSSHRQEIGDDCNFSPIRQAYPFVRQPEILLNRSAEFFALKGSKLYIMPPPLQGSGDILFFPLRLSVCLSICLSVCLWVCLSVTRSCTVYNLITVTDISTKLHTFVKHIKTTYHAQEP